LDPKELNGEAVKCFATEKIRTLSRSGGLKIHLVLACKLTGISEVEIDCSADAWVEFEQLPPDRASILERDFASFAPLAFDLDVWPTHANDADPIENSLPASERALVP
jgi:hypothetical protein